jgi:hypothetical protein
MYRYQVPVLVPYRTYSTGTVCLEAVIVSNAAGQATKGDRSIASFTTGEQTTTGDNCRLCTYVRTIDFDSFHTYVQVRMYDWLLPVRTIMYVRTVINILTKYTYVPTNYV